MYTTFLNTYSTDKLTRLSTILPILHISAGGHNWEYNSTVGRYVPLANSIECKGEVT